MTNSFIPINKEEVVKKNYEEKTVRIEMIQPDYRKATEYHSKMLLWYTQYELKPAACVSHWKKLTELFNTKPILYPIYLYKNALWAFKWNNEIVLLYKDKRGIAIQVMPYFPIEKVIPLLKDLITVLYNRRI